MIFDISPNESSSRHVMDGTFEVVKGNVHYKDVVPSAFYMSKLKYVKDVITKTPDILGVVIPLDKLTSEQKEKFDIDNFGSIFDLCSELTNV